MTKPTHQKRLSRYKRDKSAFPNFTIQERDREIVHLVFEHRFLDTELIWHLLQKDEQSETEYRPGRNGKARPVSYGFGRKALYKRLQALYHTSYLDRRFPADQPIGRGYDGPRAIYSIGSASSKLLAETAGVTPREIQRIVQANKVQDAFMRHALEVARFRVILGLACRQSEGQVRLIFWEQGLHLRDYVVGLNDEHEEKRFSVYPDAFFGLEVAGKGKANYFLELDRGTEPIVSTKQRTEIRNKLIGYRFYRKRERISKRYAYASTPDGTATGLRILDRNEQVDDNNRLRGFSVLFVTNGAATAKGSATGRIGNILSVLPGLGRFYANNSLYWFTSVDTMSLDEPESIFRNIWILPKPGVSPVSIVG